MLALIQYLAHLHQLAVAVAALVRFPRLHLMGSVLPAVPAVVLVLVGLLAELEQERQVKEIAAVTVL
jgi:uncharacterized protein YqgC (DUF456 family)